MSRGKLLSSFSALNVTQFLTAFNDNLYKLLAAFFLIYLLGTEHSNLILAIAGGVFVIPFILFASFAGSLADRYSKRTVIYFTRLLEIVTTLLGVVAFYFHSIWGVYAVLFLLAFQSTLFSPAKYGIILELVPKEKLSQSNGIVVATSYLAIILGTFFASFLTDVSDKNFLIAVSFCVVTAVLGLISSLWIEKTAPKARQKKVSVHLFRDIGRALVKAHKRRYLLNTICFASYFLFLAAYTQLNIIPLCLQSLGMTEVQGGYLFLMTAFGIGLGSFFAGKLSGSEVELGFVPFAALLAGICFVTMYSYATSFYVVVACLILIGFFGGFYVVPLEVFIQVASPEKDRGQNVATANFLNFIGVILASILLAFLGTYLELSAAFGFLVLGILTLIVACALMVLFADQVFRFITSIVARIFCEITVIGKKRLKLSDPVVLIGQRESWMDTMILMATLPRLVRYIIPVQRRKKRHRFFYYFLWLIPMQTKHVTEIGPETFRIIKQELRSGHSICLMSPLDELPARTLLEWKAHLQQCLAEIETPVAPLHILHKTPEPIVGFWRKLSSLFRYPIRVIFSTPL
ncbi:MAG: Lysophospholipid transporter LplT [Chlamydiales bacterium]|nr:Lysophospholipid transporter LplT [Chlamydiales bacterium]MCH9635108.1 Lysophospholipid transporter LplT [Chlamydiales bacterium]MCH9703824.1 MFS transporter [Chlamydiota bacterium]